MQRIKKMKKLELFLNIIHYQWFKFELWSSDIIQYPFILMMRPMYKSKWYQKRTGWDNPEKELKKAMRDPEKSVNSISAGAVMNGLLTMIFIGIVIIVSGLIRDYLPSWIFVVGGAPAFFISYIFIFKEDKYLQYFKEFDNKPENWQKKWAWITFFTIIGVSSYFVGCFTFMIHRI